MEFTKEHLVQIESMNLTEAKIFCLFLETEIIRHRDDIIQAQELINRVMIKFGEKKPDYHHETNYYLAEPPHVTYYKVDGHTIPVYKFGEVK